MYYCIAGEQAIQMKKDALIPDGHFGSDVIVVFSAVVTRVTNDFRVHYHYYLDAKQAVEPLEPSLQAESLRRHEKPYNGKPLERYVQTRTRNLRCAVSLTFPVVKLIGNTMDVDLRGHPWHHFTRELMLKSGATSAILHWRNS